MEIKNCSFFRKALMLNNFSKRVSILAYIKGVVKAGIIAFALALAKYTQTDRNVPHLLGLCDLKSDISTENSTKNVFTIIVLFTMENGLFCKRILIGRTRSINPFIKQS